MVSARSDTVGGPSRQLRFRRVGISTSTSFYPLSFSWRHSITYSTSHFHPPISLLEWKLGWEVLKFSRKLPPSLPDLHGASLKSGVDLLPALLFSARSSLCLIRPSNGTRWERPSVHGRLKRFKGYRYIESCIGQKNIYLSANLSQCIPKSKTSRYASLVRAWAG